jgi:molecular chaperone DnaK (HSP70)
VLRVPVQRAVITLPPGRSQPMVDGLRAAANRAGMALERPVSTAAAAILATLRGSKDPSPRPVLVWDWGASGLDLTLTEASPSQVGVKANVAHFDLSGHEVDSNLLREVLNAWPEDADRLSNEPMVARARLAAALEVAKRQLAEREEVRVQLPFLYAGGSIPRGFDHALRRDSLYRAMGPLVRRAFDACQQFLAAQGLAPGNLAEVIFCGGQCEVAALEPRFRAFFAGAQLHLQAPSERAVLGAALAAQRVELGMTGR